MIAEEQQVTTRVAFLIGQGLKQSNQISDFLK
jgi:hypothetical protein